MDTTQKILKTNSYTLKAIKAYHERNKDNEEFIEKRRQSKAKYYRKLKETIEFQEKSRERAKRYYLENREKILLKRKEKKKGMIVKLYYTLISIHKALYQNWFEFVVYHNKIDTFSVALCLLKIYFL